MGTIVSRDDEAGTYVVSFGNGDMTEVITEDRIDLIIKAKDIKEADEWLVLFCQAVNEYFEVGMIQHPVRHRRF